MAYKIAIIEDNQSIRDMYKFKFEGEGYIVGTAENGVKGLELVEKMRPDIVLLDLAMPEMPGEEMLAKMRATDWGKTTKVIVLTNLGEQEIPESVLKLGVRHMVPKAALTPGQVSDMVKTELLM
jgi:two-component system response regulator YesN